MFFVRSFCAKSEFVDTSILTSQARRGQHVLQVNDDDDEDDDVDDDDDDDDGRDQRSSSDDVDDDDEDDENDDHENKREIGQNSKSTATKRVKQTQ